MTSPNNLCPNCEIDARLVRERRNVPLGQRSVEIDDEFFRCDRCGEAFYTSEQADQRHMRAIQQARMEDNLLSPAQIRKVRDELTLTQRQFEELLGVGEKTCVRWESGRVCQNVATDRLIRLLAADRGNVRTLAAINAVTLPDSCCIPSSDVAEMVNEPTPWSERNFVDVPSTNILLSGTAEDRKMDTGEYRAIVGIERKGVLTYRLSGSQLTMASDFQTVLQKTANTGRARD